MRSRRGFSLVEVMVAATLSIAVLAAGYQAYIGFMRVDDIESRRESMMLGVQNVMSKIKSDVRSGLSVGGSRESLVISDGVNFVMYKNLPDGSGIESFIGMRRTKYKDITAEFSFDGTSGVNVRLVSKASVHRRPIKIEVNSFVRPRNR